jgi:hypothetical protein
MAEDLFPSDDDDDVDTGEGDTAPPADNTTIKQMREALDRAEKRNKTYEKTVEKLTEFQSGVLAERKDQAVTKVFTEVGLNPKHADLYKKLNPDLEVDAITAEAVNAFASQYELATSSGEVPDAPEVKPAGFTPVTTGTAAPASKLTSEDINKMLADGDIDGVTKAFETGRVQKEDAPWAHYQG